MCFFFFHCLPFRNLFLEETGKYHFLEAEVSGKILIKIFISRAGSKVTSLIICTAQTGCKCGSRNPWGGVLGAGRMVWVWVGD